MDVEDGELTSIGIENHYNLLLSSKGKSIRIIVNQ